MTLPSLGWLIVFFLIPTFIVARIALCPHDPNVAMGIGRDATAVPQDAPVFQKAMERHTGKGTVLEKALPGDAGPMISLTVPRGEAWIISPAAVPADATVEIRVPKGAVVDLSGVTWGPRTTLQKKGRGPLALGESRPHNLVDADAVWGWTFDSIRTAVDRDYPRIVWRTVWVSVASTFLCILLSIPIAYTMARASQRLRKTILILTIVPFWTSFIIRIFAWMQVLHTDGVLKQVLAFLRLVGPEDTLMYNMGAVLLVMVYTSLPFAILPLYAAAEKFDFSLMDAAQDLGATRFRSVLATFIPGIRSGILYATLMVLVPNLGCYVTSEVVGGTDCMLMGNRIKNCALDLHNLPHACALSLFLMIGVLIALLAIYLVVRLRGGREAVAEIARSAAENVG